MHAIVKKGSFKGHEVEIVAYEGRKVRIRLLSEGRRRILHYGWDGNYYETITYRPGDEAYVLKSSIEEVDEEERLMKELRQIEMQLKSVRLRKTIVGLGRPSYRQRKEILEKIVI